MRILAVDDDPIILDLLRTVLSEAGYTDLATASSAEEAVSMIERTDRGFDCFLFDIMMPGIDGVALTGAVRAMPQYAQTPILMVSRLDDKHHFDRAFAAGASDYVTKPFEPTELKVRLGLAEQVSRQQKALAAAAVDAPQTPLPRLAEPFQLDDVPYAINNHALESYLQSVPVGSSGMLFFALKLVNASELHRKSTGDDYHFIINSLADAVTDVLSGANYFISHAGNGVVSFVVHGGTDMTEDEIIHSIMSDASGLDVTLASGEEVVLDIVVGSSSASRITSRGARIEAMREAVLSAEGIAEAMVARELGLAAVHPMPKRSGGLFDRLFGGIAA